MTGERRTVRTTQFFEDLDRQLPAERGPNGEPSVHDFQVFDELPALIPGRADYRILITMGVLVPRLVVVGQLVSDNAIEIIELDVDINAGDE